MAIRHKRKNSAGYTWQTGDLVEGQIGLNIADGTLHFDKADGSTVTIAPVTDTNTTYAISAETGTGGVNLRLTGSDAVTDDVLLTSGIGVTLTRVDANTIDITVEPETLRTNVYNADSVTLTKGTPVYVFGAQGQNISVKRATNVGDNESSQTLGLVEDDIAAGAEGYVVTFGEINNVNTSGYTEGAPFYLGSTAGTITFTKPYAPAHLVYLGFVEKANIAAGRLFVKPQNGYELEELHNVNIDHNVALNVGDYLRRNTANTLWENSPLYISDDGAPQLGGNLDVNGNLITSASNGNVVIEPNGTGSVYLNTSTMRVGDANSDVFITTNGSGNLQISTNNTTNSGLIEIFAGSGGDIKLTPDSGKVWLNSSTVQLGNGAVTGTVTTNGANDLILNTNNGTNSGTITIVDGANANIELVPNGTGVVFVGADKMIVGDANSGSTITTNGTGNLLLNTNNGSNSGSIQINQGLAGNIVITPDTTGDIYLQGDQIIVGDSGVGVNITSNGVADLVLFTNNGTNSGAITISGANSPITLEPNGTGDVNLNADTVRVGDSGAAATITTNGTGNLILNTNAGTNAGTITMTQGANGNITLAPNGTGSVVLSGPSIAVIIPSAANQAALQVRSTVTSSATDSYPSIMVAKHRSDILLAAMTDEPAVMNFTVRDSSNTNRQFGRWIGRFQGTATNPVFTLRGSADGFTTNNHYFTYETGKALLGNGSNYTVTSGTGGSLTLTANNATTSGVITVASGANGNITLTPDGTGSIVLDGVNWPQADGTNGQVLTTNGSGQASWTTPSGGSSSQPVSVLRATSRTTETGTTYRYNFTELGDSTGITSISAGDITIATAGTYLFEFFANDFSTNPGTSWAIRNVTGAANLRLEDTFFGPSSSQYLISPMMAVHTITTSNVYAIRQIDGNLHADIYLKITKLA